MLSVGYISVDCFGPMISGAPGMRPNLYKVVYYQCLNEVPFWKSGPESGPYCKNEQLDLAYELRGKPVPRVQDSFIVYIHATFMKQIF